MSKKSLRKLAFAVCIIIVILSGLCFVWTAFTAENYRHILQDVEGYYDDKILNLYRLWYAIYICVALFEFIVLSGMIYLFIYLYKNDLSIPKEERLRIADEKREKQEQIIQNKIGRLQQKIDKLNEYEERK